ncbi:glycosyltransferase family 4 protein [Vallicoccus soli]|uniref:Glycosyltransferase n=1 Tax=Vallicoccus soli TaxID=2339232 RepID=A0A3A3Z494_9ACTN|nr:glycosyltransferase family 4 protein [Vallicoccus soli]RJK95367.1 glycosyltransferase [Vallicoccus soli]
MDRPEDDARARPPLFVTRKFPPSVGGMETLAAGVWRTLRAGVPGARLVAHGGSNRALPRWLPRAVATTAALAARREVGLVLSGDAVVHAALSPVLRALRVPHATMVMGLDVTYDSALYRATVLPWLRRAPLVVAISAATADAAVAAGVPRERVRVLRLGVEVPDLGPQDRAAARRALLDDLGLGDDAVLLLTLGRLVRRKGVRWFVEEVLPALPPQVVHLVAGDGEERGAVLDAAARAGVGDRVRLLGRVDDATRERLLRGADAFVQPNVRVPGDMEGFGLVTVEAAVRGTPVVASALEGVLDAVVDGETGTLVPPEDAAAWRAALLPRVAGPAARAALAGEGARQAAATRARYGEEAMGAELAALLGLRPGAPSA